MSSLTDFLLGRGALKKAAGSSAQVPAPLPAEPAGMDMAAEAQKMANAKIPTPRAVPVVAPANDAAIKQRQGKMPAPPAHGNDSQLKGRVGGQEDE